MTRWITLLLALLCAPAVRAADQLDAIVAGEGDPRAALAGVAIAYGTHIGGISVAKGCARFAADGLTCAEALTPAHMLRVASISKLVTALGVMRLVEKKQLSLHTDVSRYLGFRFRNPNYPAVPITLAQLLSHTSSVRDGETYWADHPDTLQSLFGPGSVHFDAGQPPGRYFTYSNLNYGVIATIIEKVTRQRFDRFAQSEIFQPLGIAAGYNWSGLEGRPVKVATLYRKTAPDGPWQAQIDDFGGDPPVMSVRARAGVAVDPAALPVGTNGTLFSPQGGLRISIDGLATIARMIVNCGRHNGKAYLRCDTVNRMSAPVWQLKPDFSNGADEEGFYQAYGLGPHRFHIDDSRELMVGHYAEAYGLRGNLIVHPATRKYAIYLFSGMAGDPARLKSDMPGLTVPEAALTKLLREHLQ